MRILPVSVSVQVMACLLLCACGEPERSVSPAAPVASCKNGWEGIRVVPSEGMTTLSSVRYLDDGTPRALGAGQQVLRLDGDLWRPKAISPRANMFNLWGSSTSDIFIAGSRGHVYHYDGTLWRTEFKAPDEQQLRDVRGFSSGKVVVVGGSYLLHGGPAVAYVFDGKDWTQLKTPAGSANLHGVWGRSISSLFAVGADNSAQPISGLILHYDGSEWTRMSIPRVGPLNAVWGTDDQHVIAVGDDGAILRFDGNVWTREVVPAGNYVAVDGTSQANVYVAGHQRLIHWNGQSWVDATPEVTYQNWRSVAVTND